MYENILQKIKLKNINIGIIGLGYVGLPLARSFTDKDISVLGFDIDSIKIDLLNQDKSYIKHISDKEIKEMKKKDLFKVTCDFSLLKNVDVIIICVPTPLNSKQEPDLTAVLDTANSITNHLNKGQLVVLESSTYPGTTDEDLADVLQKGGLKKNIDFYLAYSPEREDPGNMNFSTSTIPKIVGADDKKSLDLAVAMYNLVIDVVIPVNGTRVAEAAKLTENIFRSVNIALVNEFKVIYDAMGIDVWEVIKAASTKPFGYMPFYPGPGLGGHCIPIDPFYLTYKANEFGVATKFIQLAGEINTMMPSYVTTKIIDGIKRLFKKNIKESRILIMGISYKKDIDDTRESPSFVIMKELITNEAKVDFSDPYISQIGKLRDHPELYGKKGTRISAKNIKSYDAIVICTAHTDFDYDLLAKSAKLIIDTRNAMDGYDVKGNLVKA